MAKVLGREPRITDNDELLKKPRRDYLLKEERFYDEAPPLDPEMNVDEYWEKLEEHYESVFEQPFGGDRAYEMAADLLFQKFIEAGRFTEASSDEDIVKMLDRIAPNWRDGYLTPEEMRSIKRMLGSDKADRSDEEIGRDVRHWLEQMRRTAREKNIPPPPMPSWQRRAERLPREIVAALGGFLMTDDKG